jgi:hypothetical protein
VTCIFAHGRANRLLDGRQGAPIGARPHRQAGDQHVSGRQPRRNTAGRPGACTGSGDDPEVLGIALGVLTEVRDGRERGKPGGPLRGNRQYRPSGIRSPRIESFGGLSRCHCPLVYR